MSQLRILFLVLLFLLPALGASPPRLVVVVSVDQLSADLVARWGQDLPGGVGMLLREGTWFTAAYHEHGFPETGPGHSVLLSGRHPAHTGITENRWIDRASGKLVYCVEDPAVRTLGAPGKAGSGPKWFLGTTLAGWLREQVPGSRAFSISGKDRSAILMAGPRADGVYWFENGVGLTTSTAYTPRLPAWLEAHNRALLARVEDSPLVWTASSTVEGLVREGRRYDLPGRSVVMGLPRTVRGVGMPLDEPFWDRFRSSPFFDEAVMDAAEALLQQESLGKGPAPDLLAVGLSATDYVGHYYGNAGPEMRDQMLRLDRRLGLFLARVRQRVPEAWIVLTADHGCTDFCERLKEQGYPAQRVIFRDWMARVEEALAARLGAKGPFLRATETPQLWLREDAVKASGKSRDEALAATLAAVRAQPEVAGAFSSEELERLALDPAEAPGKRSLAARLKLSCVPGRSGDILVALKPFISFDDPRYVVNHGTPWDYDRRVPLVFFGPWAAEQRAEPVRTIDLAPTLAKELGFQPQEPLDGQALGLKAR